MKGFGFPLPAYALDEFCHPADWSAFHKPRRVAGEVLVGNGYVALRVSKGAFLDTDYAPATAEFLSRFGKLPWLRAEKLATADGWRGLDGWHAALGHRGSMGMWLGDKLCPSPVWRVGTALVRLSVLQVVARLPRAEVFFEADPGKPLFVRFSGGTGIVAADPRLTLANFEIWQPRADPLTGELRHCRPSSPGPRPPLRNWPPADMTETQTQTND